ncbi:MAG: NAD-binding protein [Planctomycetales bacterium]|nr:NAD-binding protein [bacterium]UNM08145.1 MAG: NAD-binding protein [Planctomycetales bacterium]
MNIIPSILAAFQRRKRARLDARLLLQLLAVMSGIVLIFAVLFILLMDQEGHEYGVIDAFYWVLTTMTTLGFGDIVFESPIGRIFTVVVLLVGILFIFVALPFTFIETIYASWVEAQNESLAPKKLARNVHGHVIITGSDPLSLALARKLERYNYSYVLLAPNYEAALPLADRNLNVMVGELDDAATYEQARIGIASLVAVTGMSDSMNASVLMSIRSIAPSLPLISVAQGSASADILRLAGATHVLQPIDQLGQALARRAYVGDKRARVIASVDRLLIAEAKFDGTELEGQSLRESGLRAQTGVSVLGTWHRGQFNTATPDMQFLGGRLVVLAGNAEQLERFNQLYPIQQPEDRPVVIIGGGRVGQSTANALEAMGLDYRIVERSIRSSSANGKLVVGDALEHAVLEEAGLDNASSVILTTHDDDINVYLTLYLRNYRSDLVIISRSMHEHNLSTLQRAGADFVLSHSSLGANSVFNLLKRSNIEMLAEGLDIIRMPAPLRLAGHTLAELDLRARTGCIMLATVEDGRMYVNPEPKRPIPADSEVILLATIEDEGRFLELYPQGRG